MRPVARRAFIRQTLGATLVGGLAAPPWLAVAHATPKSRRTTPLRLGGPIFVSTDDPEELALAHRKLGYRAAYCPKILLNDSARIRAVADAFARHDVVIAEVGRWVNLLDADA